MFKWRTIADHFKQMNGYIAFGFILFFAGMVVGGTNPAFREFLSGQLEGLSSLKNIVEESDNPTLTMLIVIFLNNAIKSIFVMYLGALFGILPLLFLVVNGMIVGFLLGAYGEQYGGAYVAELVVKGLLPHGIIEIPAIVVACAYGMRFGILAFKGLGSVMFARTKAAGIGRELESFVIRTVPVMVILTVSLLLAAVIESTITAWLVLL
ncbi:stage II sporulation protein M [Paenibacillus arenilitoris]|uniref:Stage II sporulation protein M n=1 Tax=Paenibacillus arenilitoris TaxID=2772299 RepID=A0A927CRP7_9BACL|nr:stage II sporulation protein M [Paenibacillus arenilitoris]MBD2872265.1 stage II sporulation protein M [Paenibacillus arenilitoris]